MRRTLMMTAVALALAGPALAAPAPASAQAAPAATEVTTQLPRTARPSHYAIEVTPHASDMRFDGKARIDVEVLVPTDTLVLQAANLVFAGGQLVAADGGTPLPATVSVDAQAQTASFAFGEVLAPGRYVLSTDYTGTINTQANGLFALDYTTAEGEKRALYTQFENSDARRFMPSWDEPDFKATFDLSVVAPAGQMVVSNMPVVETTDLGEGLNRVVFDTTPKMSTYLLFLGLGDFERATTMAEGGTEIGVIAPRGKIDQAQYALEAGRVVLEEYNDYFGVAYPLPKLDNIAAPGRSQFFSAMENWGAIFTFEHTLLLDPAISGISDQQRVFSVGAHEIAHQWFGNLVTMAWWDDLWLNEGFATWLAGRTTRMLHPEWDANGTYAASVSRRAMGRDAYATTHPVVQHVATVEQASQAFDGITYGKGGAVIAMLEDYVGPEAWRAGVRSYIAKRAYDNAVTDDLWAEMDKAAPGKHFTEVAHDFTLQPGVPMIAASTRCEGGNTVVSLEQGEYSIDNPGKAPLHWRVPVALRAGDATPVQVLVDGEASVALPGCDAPVVVNAGQKGYYRTQYAPEQFKALAAGFDALPVVDQLGVMMDAGALAAVGLQPESDLLDLVARIRLDAADDLWDVAAGTLGGIDALYDGDAEQQAAWRRYAVSRLSPKLAQLGWDNLEGEPAQTRQLRASLLGLLGRLGDAGVVDEANRRFAAFQADPSSLPGDQRRTVLGIVARNANAATWDALHALAKKETSSMIRDGYYALLAVANDEALAKRALEMALTDEPGATNSAGMIGAVSRQHPELAFDFAVAHREQVDGLLDSTSRSRYYPGLASGSNRLETVARIEDFASRHIAPTSRREAENAVVAIQTRVKLQQQRRPQIDAWLGKQG